MISIVVESLHCLLLLNDYMHSMILSLRLVEKVEKRLMVYPSVGDCQAKIALDLQIGLPVVPGDENILLFEMNVTHAQLLRYQLPHRKAIFSHGHKLVVQCEQMRNSIELLPTR